MQNIVPWNQFYNNLFGNLCLISTFLDFGVVYCRHLVNASLRVIEVSLKIMLEVIINAFAVSVFADHRFYTT